MTSKKRDLASIVRRKKGGGKFPSSTDFLQLSGRWKSSSEDWNSLEETAKLQAYGLSTPRVLRQQAYFRSNVEVVTAVRDLVDKLESSHTNFLDGALLLMRRPKHAVFKQNRPKLTSKGPIQLSAHLPTRPARIFFFLPCRPRGLWHVFAAPCTTPGSSAPQRPQRVAQGLARCRDFRCRVLT